MRSTMRATPGIRRGHRYAADSPTPGASKATAWIPRAVSSRSNGSARSRLAPSPVTSSSGRPLPRTEVRSRTPSTSTNRIAARSGEGSGERADTGDVPSDDKRLDGLRAFVGVDGLDVGHVPHHVEVEQDAVPAEQVPGLGDDLAGLAGVVHLRDR